MSIQPTDGQQPLDIQPADGQQPAHIRPRLAAVPHLEQQGAPARLRRILSRVIRGRRISRRLALLALAIEQLLIGATRPPGTTSYAENVIRSLGKTAGDRVLGKTQRILDSLASKADHLRAQQADLRTHARYRDGDLVAHPDGGVRTVAQTAGDQDKQREQIEADINRGSFRHRRLPTALRRVPLLVFGADALLLLYFFSGVTNVNWASPLSAALVFAVLLAAMVTGISFAFFRFTGDRLQQYKDDTGVIPLRGLDAATTVSMGLALGAMIILAALMFTRMRAEVLNALGPHAASTAIIIGLALALVSILANTLVIAVHALDGSAEADRLDALGRRHTPAASPAAPPARAGRNPRPAHRRHRPGSRTRSHRGHRRSRIRARRSRPDHRRRPRRPPGHRPAQRTRRQPQRHGQRHRLPPHRHHTRRSTNAPSTSPSTTSTHPSPASSPETSRLWPDSLPLGRRVPAQT